MIPLRKYEKLVTEDINLKITATSSTHATAEKKCLVVSCRSIHNPLNTVSCRVRYMNKDADVTASAEENERCRFHSLASTLSHFLASLFFSQHLLGVFYTVSQDTAKCDVAYHTYSCMPL
ncbi:hypothetical protein J6590_076145 [Homalodisca vitripennis]|nr:hypothetical protein J6590_076145 [Homalodisca vitripennis]